MDGTIPRGRLAEALTRIRELSEKYGCAAPTCYMPATASSPLDLFDANLPGEMDRAEAFGPTSCAPASNWRRPDRRARRRRRGSAT